jgi:hemerythrin superfamily protein
MVEGENAERFLQPGPIMKMVLDDHRHILTLFELYLSTPADSRQTIVDEILQQLDSHLKREEVQLYAPLRQSGQEGQRLVDDALLEHEEIGAMMSEIQTSETDDDQALDEFFEDMMQTVRAHFEAEEQNMFPLEAALFARQPDRP